MASDAAKLRLNGLALGMLTACQAMGKARAIEPIGASRRQTQAAAPINPVNLKYGDNVAG